MKSKGYYFLKTAETRACSKRSDYLFIILMEGRVGLSDRGACTDLVTILEFSLGTTLEI